jgi:hypothetical protein
MLPTPLLHALHFFLAAEVVPTGSRAPPTALAGEFAGLSTSRGPTVILTGSVAVIGVKERLAATALAPGGSAAHHRMNRQARREKSTKKTDREEDPDSKKEEELSTRRAEENSTPRKPNFKPALLSDYHSAADTHGGTFVLYEAQQ